MKSLSDSRFVRVVTCYRPVESPLATILSCHLGISRGSACAKITCNYPCESVWNSKCKNLGADRIFPAPQHGQQGILGGTPCCGRLSSIAAPSRTSQRERESCRETRLAGSKPSIFSSGSSSDLPQEPSSRPQPQDWITLLDPWVQDVYPVLG